MNKWKIGCIALIGSCLALTLAVSLALPYPISWDFMCFHIKIAEAWARGENGMMLPLVMQINKIPYPPMFHWLLALGVLIGQGYNFGRLLQIIFSPIVTISCMWLIKKETDSTEQAFYVGLFLLTINAFMDAAFQVHPQTIEMLLFPIVTYAYLKNKGWLLILASTLMVWVHGIVSIVLLGGIFILLLKEKREAELIGSFAFSFPMLAVNIYYLVPALQNWMGAPVSTPEEAFFQNPILFTFLYLAPALFVALPLLVYNLTKWKSLTRFQKVTVLSILSMAIMLVPWPDRFLQYASIPLAWIGSEYLSHFKYKNALMPILLFFFGFFMSIRWVDLITNNYNVFVP